MEDIMEIVDKRGHNKIEIGERNKKMIFEYISKKPNCSKSEICKALGLTFKTVQKHIEAIQEEIKCDDNRG